MGIGLPFCQGNRYSPLKQPFLLALANHEIKGTPAAENDQNQYWWKYILEGLQMGQKIEEAVNGRKQAKCRV